MISNAHAHEGPPYPVLLDLPVETHRLSVWADPDVGTGNFQVFLQDGDPAAMAGLEVSFQARPAQGSGDGLTHVAKPTAPDKREIGLPFSHEGNWTVHLRVARDGTTIAEKDISVDVTPPGPTPVEFWVYLLPFLAVGFLWGKVLWHKRRGGP
jgi:hypothetical protein